MKAVSCILAEGLLNSLMRDFLVRSSVRTPPVVDAIEAGWSASLTNDVSGFAAAARPNKGEHDASIAV